MDDPADTSRAALPSDRMVVFFDGYCGMCNGFVDRILRHPRRDRFRFAPRQGDAFQRLLGSHPQLAAANSIVAVPPRRADGAGAAQPLIRSSAVIAILRELGGARAALAGLLAGVPAPLRDLGYRVVASLRHHISRRRQACRTPADDERAFFLA